MLILRSDTDRQTLKPSSRATTLDTQQINDTIERLPTERLDAITELKVGSLLPDANRFLRFIHRCPKVVSLTCGRISEDPPTASIGSDILPFLKRFQGRLGIAKLLIPGRPLTDLTISSPFEGATPQPITEILPILTTGTASITRLYLIMFLWTNGCIEEISRVSFRNWKR